MASKTIKGSPNSIQHMFCQEKNFIQTDNTFQSICNFLPLHELYPFVEVIDCKEKHDISPLYQGVIVQFFLHTDLTFSEQELCYSKYSRLRYKKYSQLYKSII